MTEKEIVHWCLHEGWAGFRGWFKDERAPNAPLMLRSAPPEDWGKIIVYEMTQHHKRLEREKALKELA